MINRLEQIELLDLSLNTWKKIPKQTGFHDKGVSLFANGARLYRMGGANNPNVILSLDCTIHDCLNCEDCDNKWKVSENALDLKRTHSGYTLIPEEFVQDCSCTFHSVDVSSDHYERLYDIPSAENCYGKCLEHTDCQFFLWVSPTYQPASQHYECWLKWGNLGSPAINNGCLSNYRNCWTKFDV